MPDSTAKSRTFACKVAEVGIGQPKIVTSGRKSVGVFQLSDGCAALLNVCPHRAEFIYERAGELIRCAWHGWEFDIRTGTCLVDERLKARTFPVYVDGDDIYLELGR